MWLLGGLSMTMAHSGSGGRALAIAVKAFRAIAAPRADEFLPNRLDVAFLEEREQRIQAYRMRASMKLPLFALPLEERRRDGET
jgi:hypothetical protein